MNPASSTDSRVSLRTRFRTATREAILDAAAELLGGDGATHTRMEDIAARAGVAVGTVYNYFEDRTALVSALLEMRRQTLLEALDAAEARASAGAGRSAGSPATADAFEAELERFVSALGAYMEANRFLLSVLHEEKQSRGIDARSASQGWTLLGELLVRAERLMVKGIRMRALRKDDPALYAALLVGMVRGVVTTALTRREAFSIDRTAAIVQVFMRGAAR